jgi:hypothetical protein
MLLKLRVDRFPLPDLQSQPTLAGTHHRAKFQALLFYQSLPPDAHAHVRACDVLLMISALPTTQAFVQHSTAHIIMFGI